MSTGTLSIHSENILPIIKKWLYSDKDIFVRELVSNACDAIHKVKVLRDQGQCDAKDEDFRIDVRVDKEGRTLTFADTGIGMSAEEVEKYIAQLAFSGAEEFVEKYQSANEKDQIIGHFGLGFYSAYMVAEKVDLQTLSYRAESEAAHWVCDGTSDYTIEKGERAERGTTITLHVGHDSDEYLEEGRIREILEQYCAFLPYPIHLNDQLINKQEPLWLKSPAECSDQDYLDFYRHLYPMDAEPLFWIHLNVDYPFHLKGILYFPKLRRDHDMNQSNIQLYCNRVFVSDNCKDLIPDYLMMLKGAIDSPDIPLNVSRSYLQTDRTVRQVGTHISKKVCDRLASLYKTDKEQFLKAWPDIELIVKLGILQDEKFYERAKEFLVWKNTEGEWTTVEDYLERNGEKTDNKIFYSSSEKHQSTFLNLFKDKGIEVLHTNHVVDTHLLSFLEGKLAPANFRRIDGGVEEAILDKDREKTILDEDGKTAASHLADVFRQGLPEDIKVEAKSLASDHLPGFVMMDEQMRRMRDFMMHNNPEGASEALKGFTKHTFVVNTNNPLVHSIEKLSATDPALSQALTRQLYDLALISQREMDAETLSQFVTRNHDVLAKLAEQASQ